MLTCRNSSGNLSGRHQTISLVSFTFRVVTSADFIRIGSVRRINKRLLRHSLHSRQDKGAADATSELNDMLKACTCETEASFLRQELAEVSRAAAGRRGTAVTVDARLVSRVSRPRKPVEESRTEQCMRVGGEMWSVSAETI